MNNTSTFQFLFYDLFTKIDKCQIEYGYKVIEQDIELKSGAIIHEGCYWDLDIWKVCGSSTYTAFHNDISRITKNTINEIKNDLFELAPTLSFLSQKIEEKIKIVQLLLEWDETQISVLNNLLNNHEIEFIFQGYQDYSQDIVETYGNPGSPDIGQNDYAYLIKKLSPYFDLLNKELNRIFLFLCHLQNLSQIKSEIISSFNSSNIKSKLLKLVKEGEIGMLISELNKDITTSTHPDFIHLSAKYYNIERRNKLSLISREDYDFEYSKIIEISISVIENIKNS